MTFSRVVIVDSAKAVGNPNRIAALDVLLNKMTCIWNINRDRGSKHFGVKAAPKLLNKRLIAS